MLKNVTKFDVRPYLTDLSITERELRLTTIHEHNFSGQRKGFRMDYLNQNNRYYNFEMH